MSDPEIVMHVAASVGLTPAEAGRVVDDVLAWYREDADSFVRRRHADLQSQGVRNAQAFDRIAVELGDRLVAAPRLSLRQLRRIVYG